MEVLLVVLLVTFLLSAVIGFRLLLDRLDRGRIRAYVADRDGYVEEIRWDPFGYGWFGAPYNRIYRVTYVNRKGNRHVATCKTSILAGIYWAEDAKVSGVSPPAELRNTVQDFDEEIGRLKEENAQLQDEVGRLRQQMRGPQ
jgi:hypothetical protein